MSYQEIGDKLGLSKQGISLFGQVSDDGTKILPVDDLLDVPEIFRRDEYGTDLYILGFERTDDWMDQTVFSVLENFFYAIWKNRLEVIVKEGDREVKITNSTLEKIIDQ